MYKNLEKEMKSRGIKREQLVDLLEIAYNTVSGRINGDTRFYLDEALKVKKVFFPELEIEYLFNFSEED